jgi:hypothetical protein
LIFITSQGQNAGYLSGQRELIFLVPNDLASGEYTVEVRARFGGEHIRAGFLEQPVSVP